MFPESHWNPRQAGGPIAATTRYQVALPEPKLYRTQLMSNHHNWEILSQLITAVIKACLVAISSAMVASSKTSTRAFTEPVQFDPLPLAAAKANSRSPTKP